MAKIPEAEARIVKNKYVCKKCKSVVRAPSLQVIKGKVKCKKCSSKKLRTKRKK